MPEHPLLHVALALAEQVTHVQHEIVALPVVHRDKPPPGLRVVVAPVDDAAGELAVNLRLVDRVVLRGFLQPAVDRRLIVDVRGFRRPYPP